MQMLDRSSAARELSTPLSLDEYLSFPEDARCEIVDGVLRPMVRSNLLHREVQFRLTQVLASQCPDHLVVAFEQVVVFSATPPNARIPDVLVFKAGTDPTGRYNFTPAADVALAVEIVSESTQTADRYEKPAEYARNGIPRFWRIELEPSIVVWTYRLLDGVYRDEGRFRFGGLVKDSTMDWISIEVTELLRRFAPRYDS
jgi:Uma2 family endonuclease